MMKCFYGSHFAFLNMKSKMTSFECCPSFSVQIIVRASVHEFSSIVQVQVETHILENKTYNEDRNSSE